MNSKSHSTRLVKFWVIIFKYMTYMTMSSMVPDFNYFSFLLKGFRPVLFVLRSQILIVHLELDYKTLIIRPFYMCV